MSVTAAPLVGREAELASLGSVLDAARRGEPGVVVLGGDAGVGKTRLVREVTEHAESEAWTVLTGRCIELSEGAAVLAPVAEVLRQLSRRRGDDVLARLLDGPARWLAPLVPELGVEADDLETNSATQVLVSFHRLLRDLADQQPVLLVLEDLHWADATTRDLLRHLASRLYDERLAIVATVRTDDVDRRHPLRPVLAEVTRLPQVDRIDLGPLDDEALTAHLAGLAEDGHRLDLPAIAARSQGNPFYAEELLAAGDGRLPPSLEDVLSLRLEQLPDDAQRLLGQAAVLGTTVDATLLERVTDLPGPSVATALRAALDHGVLQLADGGVAWRHALLREVALDRLLPHERVAAHAAAAAALEADPDLAAVGRAGVHGQVAHHWWEARDMTRCLVASVAAAEEAARVAADGVALRHARRAIELWDRVEDAEDLTGTTYPSLLLAATIAAVDADDAGAQVLGRAAIRAADEVGDATTRAAAVTKLTVHLVNTSREADALELTGAERARHGTERTTARSLALSAHAMAVSVATEHRVGGLDLDEVAADLDEALVIARECGDDFAEYRALMGIAQVLGGLVPDRLDEAVRELHALVDRAGVREWANGPHHVDTFVSFFSGDFGRSDRAVAGWWGAGPEPGPWTGASWVPWALRITIDTWRGRTDAALDRVDEIDIREVTGTVFTIGQVAVAAGEVLRWTGQTQRALARAELASQSHSGTSRDVHLASELAASRAAAGAPLRDVVVPVADTPASWHLPGWHAFVPRFVAAVAEAAQDAAIDESLLAEVDRPIEQLAGLADWLRDDAPARPWVLTCLQHARAERAFMAGTPDPALWDPVVADFDARGLVARAAQTRLRRATARAAADGGPSPASEEDLLAAWDVFTDCGLTALQDRATALATRLRVDLPGWAPDDRGLPDLTEREREVLALVAEGWTNKRVGEHLFISPKTVSVHMSNAMRKLDVDSRTEAVAVAHRAGLLEDG